MIKKLDGGPKVLGRCAFGLGQAKHLLNKLEEAEKYLVESLEHLKEVHQQPHWNVAETIRSIARLYRDQGRKDDASDYYLEALDILVKLKSLQMNLVLSEYLQFKAETVEAEKRPYYEGLAANLEEEKS